MTARRKTLGICALGFALALGAGCEEDAPLEHDFVKIQLLRADNQPTSPFGGTDTITAQVRYFDASSTCIEDFYRANPNWQEDGIEGAEVFTEWEETICDMTTTESTVPCISVTIDQFLDDTAQMQLKYKVTGADIENKVLIVGPLPTTELVECEAGQQPTVSLFATGVSGSGSGGGSVWQGLSAPVDNAAVGQGLPMKVKVQQN